MRKIFIIAALLIGSLNIMAQSVYYVQDVADNVNASDSNAGTDINYPWATWQKAFDTADAGDVVYFRGSTWYPITQIKLNPGGGNGNPGTASNPIIFRNYPGESPIVDFSNHYWTSTFTGVDVQYATNVEFHGLKIQNVWQNVDGQWIAGWNFSNNVKVHLEQMEATRIGGSGFWLGGNDTIMAINNDAYDLIDSTTTSNLAGGRADGFNVSSGAGDGEGDYKYYEFTGNRAWRCSDDGFDINSSKQLLVYNNWAFDNGRLEGDASGFKFGYCTLPIPSNPEDRTIRNNLSAWNMKEIGLGGNGFGEMNLYSEDYGAVTAYYNNTSYQDYQPFFTAASLYNACEVGYWDVWYTNNLTFDPVVTVGSGSQFSPCNYGPPDYATFTTNTFIEGPDHWAPLNPAFNVTTADFVNPDSTTIYNQLTAPRQSDGSLPEFTALTLTSGSDLIDGGTDVGLPYNGSAPDLGAFEFAIAAAPVAAFMASSTSIFTGEPVTFTDQSLNIPTSWAWTFGDTGTSALQNPTYSYSSAGTYTVALTVTNAEGSDTETKIDYITVSDPPSGAITNSSEYIAAHDAASPGDTLVLEGNSFTGSVNLTTNGFNGVYIVTVAGDGFDPVFSGNVVLSGDYNAFRNVTFSNALTTSFAVAADIQYCTFTTNGLSITPPWSDFYLEDYVINNNTYIPSASFSVGGRAYNLPQFTSTYRHFESNPIILP